jgi:threonine aldolase
MGGGMRQVGILAAAGFYALDHNLERLAEDHALARRIAEALAPYGVVDPSQVRTNLIPLDLSKTSWDAPGLTAAAAAEGVLIAPMLTQVARLVTHLDLDDAGADHAIDVLGRLLS